MNHHSISKILISLALYFGTLFAAPVFARPELILLEESNAAYAENVVNNINWIQGLPVDGIVIGMDILSFNDKPIKTATWVYNDIYPHIAPLVGTFPKLKSSYLRVNVQDMGDPFDDWSHVWRNWAVVAKAARAAGLKGIFFDNETYINKCVFVFACPVSLGAPTLLHEEKGLLAYQNQFRSRGVELMHRLQVIWPDIRIIHAHGPYYSQLSSVVPPVISKNVPATETDLRGYFFGGMFRAVLPAAAVIDGGELYNLRGAADFDAATAYRRTGITLQNTNLVCSALQPSTCKKLKAAWSQTLKLGYGVFDTQQVFVPPVVPHPYPMNPAVFAETIYQALRTSDGPVWLYTDGFSPNSPDRSYLSPGHVDQSWIDAIAQAVARAGP